MENPLTNTYAILDRYLVDRASGVVKAWNWTTGRTRAELADVLNVCAGALNVIDGAIEQKDTSEQIFFGLWGAVGILALHGIGHTKDRLEAKAEDVIDHRVKEYDTFYKVLGPIAAIS